MFVRGAGRAECTFQDPFRSRSQKGIHPFDCVAGCEVCGLGCLHIPRLLQSDCFFCLWGNLDLRWQAPKLRPWQAPSASLSAKQGGTTAVQQAMDCCVLQAMHLRQQHITAASIHQHVLQDAGTSSMLQGHFGIQDLSLSVAFGTAHSTIGTRFAASADASMAVALSAHVPWVQLGVYCRCMLVVELGFSDRPK